MSVPKIIHQLWIGPKSPPKKEMETWKEFNPDWEYMFWDDESFRTYFPNGLYNQLQYDQMPEWNEKCDIARYEILFKFGGFFIDADSICLRPLDDDLLDVDSFSCYENERCRGDLIAAGDLGAIKENKLMSLLIEELHQLKIKKPVWWKSKLNAWKTVGPKFLTETVRKYKYTDLMIYPSHYFIPKHYTGLEYTGPFKPYCTQLWGSTPKAEFTYESNADT